MFIDIIDLEYLHLQLFKKSQEHRDFLIVIVNSDNQRKLKGSLEFMDENERLMIVQAIKYVGHAFISIDQDRTQIESLKYLHKQFGSIWDLHFVNGGDQNNDTIPESVICNELGITLVDGVGDKVQSSSWLLNK